MSTTPTSTIPQIVQSDYPVFKHTTVRAGGNAEYFARVGSLEDLKELLQWTSEASLGIAVIGSGSNLLVADDGVPGLVIKLESALAKIEQVGNDLLCGGGARLPAAAAYSARAGLAGLEFGVNIPGTVGGAVKMNANAYGGQLDEILSWVEVVTADGVQRRTPDRFEFTYRNSNLRSNEVVTQACFSLEPSTPEAVKKTLADLRERRKAAQPSGIKTFGSTFKNPQDPRAEGRTSGQLLEAAGCKELSIGGARFSSKHANFVDNDGTATTAEIVALMLEGRRMVQERFKVNLEPEVQVLGNIDWPDDSPSQVHLRTTD